MEERYNAYSYKTFCRLVKEGQDAQRAGKSDDDLFREYAFMDFNVVMIGYDNPDWIPEEPKTFYRIGEPILDELAGEYRSSFNFMDNCPEMGVSVINKDWIESMRAVFFGISSDKLAKRGVYEIEGIRLPYKGGDGEPLIYPTNWAKKTRIQTVAGLKRKL